MTTFTSEPVLPVYVGIDVAKHKLDLARSDRPNILTVSNDRAGVVHILGELRRTRSVRVVVEATGGYERPILDALLEAEIPVAVVNPGHVRHFAKGLGILAKTDAIDALVLVKFAQLASPRLAGKRSKVVIVACMRKLLVILNAMVREHLTWDQLKLAKNT